MVGFTVSCIGSIPLGYLNLIGFQIYTHMNWEQLLYFLLGVIVEEAIVVYGTLQMVHQLQLSPKWKSGITAFSVFFLIFLAYYFYTAESKNVGNIEEHNAFLQFPVFITGIFLSAVNFAQIPFWMSWNLLLINGNYITASGKRKWFYILGTLMGTFSGMVALILGLDSISGLGLIQITTLSKSIPWLLIILAFFQIYQLVRQQKMSSIS